MYIDTSFLVAYYVPEDLSSHVYDLITDAETVHISAITKLEFLSALNKKVRMGFFTSEETQIAFRELEKHVSDGLHKQFEVSSNHFRSSTEIIQQSSIADIRCNTFGNRAYGTN